MKVLLSIMLVVSMGACGHYGHEYAKADHQHSAEEIVYPIIPIMDYDGCTCEVLISCPDGRLGCLVAHYLGCEIHPFEERFPENIFSATSTFWIGNATADLIIDATLVDSIMLEWE